MYSEKSDMYCPEHSNFSVISECNDIKKDNLYMSGGGCRVSGCSCTSFVVKSRNDAQWCENCGHLRSQHVNG